MDPYTKSHNWGYLPFRKYLESRVMVWCRNFDGDFLIALVPYGLA